MAGYTKLMRLTNAGVAIVDEEFLTNQDADPIIVQEAVDDIESNIALQQFSRAIAEVIQQFPDPPSSDAWLAKEIHRALGLPRGIAMDVRVWQFLSCVAHPEYVWYRWSKAGQVSKERFLGGIKRNAFARLWWAAEVMKNGDDYQVEPCFDSQDLYEAVFGRSFSKYPPAAKAFIKAVSNQERGVIRAVAKDFNLMLSTFVLEDLATQQVEKLIAERISVRSSSG